MVYVRSGSWQAGHSFKTYFANLIHNSTNYFHAHNQFACSFFSIYFLCPTFFRSISFALVTAYTSPLDSEKNKVHLHFMSVHLSFKLPSAWRRSRLESFNLMLQIQMPRMSALKMQICTRKKRVAISTWLLFTTANIVSSNKMVIS